MFQKLFFILIALVIFITGDSLGNVLKLTDDPDCYSGDSSDYDGTQSSTESGLECQRWDKQEPHKHDGYEDEQFPDGSKCKAKNYCRDPGNDGFVWCYTIDPNKRWEKCDINWCEGPARNNNTHDCYIITEEDRESGRSDKEICESQPNRFSFCPGKEEVPPGCEDCDRCCQEKDCRPENHRLYNGTWHRTESGIECQRWDSQTPHKHEHDKSGLFPADDTVTAAQNYCRDPEFFSGFLWCYTMDPSVTWEKCGIPECESSTEC